MTYTKVEEGEESAHLGDSRTTQVLGKGKILLKLTSGKTLALNEMLHIPNIRTNLISIALLGKVGVKVSFESDKVLMIKIIFLLARAVVVMVCLYLMFSKL